MQQFQPMLIAAVLVLVTATTHALENCTEFAASDKAGPANACVRGSVCNPAPTSSSDSLSTDESTTQSRDCPCVLRDEGEGEGEGEPYFAVSAGGQRTVSPVLRHVIPIAAGLLVIAFAVSGTSRAGRHRRKTLLLAVCAATAIGNYTDFGRWPADRYVNAWEFFHYYLGSKYLPELGYTRLYEAAIVADVETGRKFNHPKDAIRNLADGGCIAVDDVLQRRTEIIANFSPMRWADFTQDVRHFKSALSQEKWNHIFHDKGYNATPVWSMFVGRLTNVVNTSHGVGMYGLALLDAILLLVALIAVWRAFDQRTALLMVVLIGTHMTMSHTHMKGALLRTDWVVALVLSICAVKTQRPVAGGMLAAYAATARVFPAVFAVGLLAKPVLDWATGDRRVGVHCRFSTAFALTCGTLVAASLLAVGPGIWVEFVHKIAQHNDTFGPWRVGFKHLFLGAYDYRPATAASFQEIFHQRWYVWWAIQLLLLGGFVIVTRRLESWETLALGFIPTFFLVAPTYYYYIMLVIPMLFFSSRIHRAECTVGCIWLLVSANIAYAIHDVVGRELQLFYAVSLMVFGVCTLMAVSAVRQYVARPYCAVQVGTAS